MAVSSAARRAVTASSRSRQTLPTPLRHSRSRAEMTSASAAWAVVTAGVVRDALAVVTSEMFTLANPTDDVTANANVASQRELASQEIHRGGQAQIL
jgi:hypothetical protein